MIQNEAFSEPLNKFLTQTYSNGIKLKMAKEINNELFEECNNFIILHKGLSEKGLPYLKGWAFESALFPLLYTDQKILLYLLALKMNYHQSRTWKLLGLEYFNVRMYPDAIIALKIALGQGLSANPDATLELLGACLTFNGETEEGKTIFLKSSRVDFNFILSNYGGITQYAELAFGNEVSLSREDITVNELSLKKFIREQMDKY